ncbi:hypothetical protein NDU88_010179 [Pleurodeles waltl]|uniref:Basic leucine zipper transcriptional factor ATF-like n=1 Tax=Pleurodeles waltl TaxID=8319 RepID=A0AAV7RYH0_PLEWA|nr:hypothetical protein NDU88_010179 [Pleurodeles waltl]
MAGVRVSGSIFQRGSASTPSESEQDSSQVQSPELDDRKVRRREKNRVAAQRSRKKQTQKADSLHKEYECLEQENGCLKKEVAKLAEEVKRLSGVLKAHEQICPLLLRPVNLVTMPRTTDGIPHCLPR